MRDRAIELLPEAQNEGAAHTTGMLGQIQVHVADAFSLELTRAPEAFISFERRIVLQNLADIDPPRWLQALLAEWKGLRAENYGWGGFEDSSAVESLAAALIHSGKAEAVEALIRDDL